MPRNPMASGNSNFLPDRSRRPISTLHEWSRHEDVSDRLFRGRHGRIPSIDVPESIRSNDSASQLLLGELPLSPKSATSITAFPPSSISGASMDTTTFSIAELSIPDLTTSSTIQTLSELGDIDPTPRQGVLQLLPNSPEIDTSTFVPSSTSPIIFKCRFWFLNCSYSSPHEPEWKTHNLAHFHGHTPPRSSCCPFCDTTFNIPDPLVSWAANMSHVAQHFKEGLTLATGRPDFGLFRYLWSVRVICDVDYQELMGNYSLRHGRRPYVVLERRDRRERRGLPMPQSRM